jgi:hypothetical protein
VVREVPGAYPAESGTFRGSGPFLEEFYSKVLQIRLVNIWNLSNNLQVLDLLVDPLLDQFLMTQELPVLFETRPVETVNNSACMANLIV